MHRLLVALDLSTHADRAFERARLIAEEHNAQLMILHVINDNLLGYEDEDGSLAQTLMEKASHMVERYMAPLHEDMKKRVTSRIVIGKAWKEILSTADECSADLIIIGLHHIQPIKDIFIGTTAEKLIRNCSRPVLVVSEKAAESYRTAVAATDFSSCSAHALAAGLELAPNATFHLLHVYETPFPAYIQFSRRELEEYTQPFVDAARLEATQAMNVFMKGHDSWNATISPLLEHNETVTGIGKTIREQKADLLVMGTHGSRGIKGAMLGSVAMIFLNDPPCDVLVTH